MSTRRNRTIKKKTSANSRKMPLVIKVAVVWVVGYLLFSIGANQVKLISLDSELKTVEKQVAAQEDRAKELSDTKGKIDTPEYKERMARERLGFLKPDEKVFIDATVK